MLNSTYWSGVFIVKVEQVTTLWECSAKSNMSLVIFKVYDGS